MESPKAIGDALDAVCERIETMEREWDEARRLLTNVLRGDDGHDWKEARRYIESTHPESTPDIVHGKFLPDNPNQFDYLHAIRAIASRTSNKQIFDLADAAMNPANA